MVQNIVSVDHTTDVDFDPTKFDGKWRMATSDSTVRDPNSGEMVQERLLGQWMENRTDGHVMTYAMGVKIAEDLTVYMGYTVTINDPGWVPYSVVKIDGDPDHPRLKPNDVLKAGTVLGQPIAWIKHVYIDQRHRVRITKNLDGSAQYILQSVLSEDFNKLYGYVMTPDGHLSIDKHFYRESD